MALCNEKCSSLFPPTAGRKDEVTLENIKKFCDGKIARFKVPYYVWVIDAFPLTGAHAWL